MTDGRGSGTIFTSYLGLGDPAFLCRPFDDYLASAAPLHAAAKKLFQGPVADALTHVGQLTYLRRLSGAPMRGENYLLADIAVGCIGGEQATPNREFD